MLLIGASLADALSPEVWVVEGSAIMLAAAATLARSERADPVGDPMAPGAAMLPPGLRHGSEPVPYRLISNSRFRGIAAGFLGGTRTDG